MATLQLDKSAKNFAGKTKLSTLLNTKGLPRSTSVRCRLPKQIPATPTCILSRRHWPLWPPWTAATLPWRRRSRGPHCDNPPNGRPFAEPGRAVPQLKWCSLAVPKRLTATLLEHLPTLTLERLVSGTTRHLGGTCTNYFTLVKLKCESLWT